MTTLYHKISMSYTVFFTFSPCNGLDMDLFRAEQAKEKEDYAFVAATKQMVIKAMEA